MGYASSVVDLASKPTPVNHDGKDYLESIAAISGEPKVNIIVRTYAGSVAAKAFADKDSGDRLLVSGDICLEQPDGNVPILTASVIATGYADQYLNEVVIIGNLGSAARDSGSGKSIKRSVACNRHIRNPDPEQDKPIEVTDWFGIRAYGFNKTRLESLDKGSLVEVTGSLEQMINAKGEPFCELKARSIKVHRAGKGLNPAAGTSAVGYDQESFQGSPDPFPSNWN